MRAGSMTGNQAKRYFKKRKRLLRDEAIALEPIRFYGESKEYGFRECVEFDIVSIETGQKIGEIALRTGESRQIYYLGHIGYHISAPFRGHGYAARACKLLMPCLRELGVSSFVITADPDNLPSRKTIERIGGVLECEVSVPRSAQKELNISPRKCRYIVFTA